jgi:electron transport complex protein RnfB
MLSAALVLLILIALGVWMLLHHLEPERDSRSRLIARVDEILPQTQCRECGYHGCLPYAEAIVAASESIDRCPPGGDSVRRSLAELLGRTAHSERRAADLGDTTEVVVIDEPICIGCTKCIAACPVDAIVGAAKQMHTVVESLCTGCKLCIAPCPVDCIDVVDAARGLDSWRWPAPGYAGLERRERSSS